MRPAVPNYSCTLEMRVVAGRRLGRTVVPHIAFLDLVRRLFVGADPADARRAVPADGRSDPPVHPMSDRELSRAIRELRTHPSSETAPDGLAPRPPHGGRTPS
jgi:hypothetical protein